MQLSIIIPVYNGEKYIGNLLHLLIKQNLENMEILVINDGSDDRTESIIKEILKKDSRISLISFEDNQGVSIARNIGLKLAKGKYIYFLDVDDTIHEGTLDFFRDILEQKQSDVFIFGFEQLKNGKIKKFSNKKLHNKTFNSFLFFKYFFCIQICTNICTQIFLRNFLINYNIQFPEDKVMGEDTFFWRTAILHAKTIYYNKRKVFLYKIRSDSTMQGYRVYNINVFNAFIEEIILIKKIVEIFPELIKYANYYLARRFCSSILMYSRSIQKEKYVAEKLIGIKYLLLKKMIFRFPQTIIFHLFSIFPLKLFFNYISK